jgi:hypothetical protein
MAFIQGSAVAERLRHLTFFQAFSIAQSVAVVSRSSRATVKNGEIPATDARCMRIAGMPSAKTIF